MTTEACVIRGALHHDNMKHYSRGKSRQTACEGGWGDTFQNGQGGKVVWTVTLVAVLSDAPEGCIAPSPTRIRNWTILNTRYQFLTLCFTECVMWQCFSQGCSRSIAKQILVLRNVWPTVRLKKRHTRSSDKWPNPLYENLEHEYFSKRQPN